jgi:peroxiredoxin
VYREKPALRPQPELAVTVQRVQVMNRAGVVETRTSRPAPVPQPSTPLGLHLRTGDNIPCEVNRIDEQGVWIRSPESDAKFVPHAKVQAIELARLHAPVPRLSKSKRERLLMLPRMQKDSPPTHLVQSRNGDYLRGRVVAMDDATLQVEVRLETKDVPRDRIARIIWLHTADSAAAGKPAADEGTPALRVQAVRNDGSRLTLQAERVADGVISGASDVLGPCRAVLKTVDQLLIGQAIERDAAQLAYQQWKLQDAPEPKAFEESGTSAGSQSPLVGKPAPEFALELLDGKSFRLSEQKGRVLVLDFWATWCGPCIQSMPEVERVTREFAAHGVRLVAVNLQESPKPIKAMLERQKLDLTVALDRDGSVAGKYGASAIPQTVVIDKDGNVARVFVGAGTHLADQLREALKAVLPE